MNLHKLIIKILIFIFVLSNINFAFAQIDSLKIALIPDLHLSFNQEDNWVIFKETPVIFQNVINELNARSDIDYVFFGGDLINNDDKKLTDTSYIEDVLTDFKHCFYTILGDREADLNEGYEKTDFTSEFKKNGFSFSKQTYYIQDLKDGYVLIGLDTTIKNKFEGELDKDQLDWLKKNLELAKDKKVIILMHHPALITSEIPFNRDFLLKNSSEFLELAAKYPNIKLVLSGHLHMNSIVKQNKTYFITSSSVSTYPNSFKILTIYNDRFEVENQKIKLPSFIKKSKKLLPDTEYAKKIIEKPQDILKFTSGNNSSNKKEYFFN
ncbi:MAG: metallophosphoesterase [Candidatus Gastranaerophilaceae bacterium]|jgi:3',5'-cyclic AMP phosphodiesterase CpdA